MNPTSLWTPLGAPLGTALTWISRAVVHSADIHELHAAPIPTPAIFVNWHRHLPLLTVHHGRRGRWILMSQAPRMAPIAEWATQSGLRLVRGTSGEGGRDALEPLEALLRKGESIVLAVDGPRGPAFQVRPGCVELSRKTGVPIVPVGYEVFPKTTVPFRWDRMSLVLPFSRVRIRYGTPIDASSEPESEVLLRVAQGLNALDADR
jgi:lysophospholipid acyltransferase (LPLAT)-like uncharacterized protein